MLNLPDKPLTEVMLEAGMITEEQHQEILTKVESGSVSVEQALRDYASDSKIELAKRSLAIGYPCVNLEELPKDGEAVAKMHSVFAFKNRVAPIRLEENILTVAMTDPLDVILIDDIRLVTNYEVQPLLAEEADILDALRRFYGKTAEEVIEEAKGPIGVAATREIERIRDYGLDAETLARDPTVKEAVDQLIIDAVRAGASDIHIEPFETEGRIRYRIDGVLEEQPKPPRHLQAAITSRVKIMAELNIAERRRPQDGKIPLNIETLGNRQVDIRVSTIPSVWGESVVLRLLDKQAISYGLEHLGLMEDNLRQFKRMIKQPHGVILATGPTGSGKTTTLYACLRDINQPGVKIITIEDPVEYDLVGITQIQINPEINVTFAIGLRHILRHDPDIVMVGEIRDYETAEMAIHTALTGHLVFSTLHTNDAPSAITRLIDMDVEPFLIASTIEGIVAQRLARQVCRYCRELYHPEPEVLLDMGINPETIPKDLMVPRQVGCKECRGVGYSGRIGIFEVIMMNDKIREMCMKGISSTEIKREATRSAGMKTLREDGWRKVAAGMTTIEEVMRLTPEQEFDVGQI